MTYRMTCMDALDALLTADLSPHSNAPAELRVHLQACARCQRVAASLRAETEALAVVAASVPITRTSRRTRTSPVPQTAALAFAALLLVVLVSRRPSASEEHGDTPMPVSADVSAETLSARVFAPATAAYRPPATAAVTRDESIRSAPRIARVSTTELRPITVASEPIATPSRVEVLPVVAVDIALDEASGQQDTAAVEAPHRKPVLLAQSNPKITVYWVY